MNTAQTYRVSGPLRARINQLAHQLALEHEITLRAALTARMQAAAALAEQHALLDELSQPISESLSQ